MKSFWKDLLAGIMMGLVVPGIFLNAVHLLLEQQVLAQQTMAVQSTQPEVVHQTLVTEPAHPPSQPSGTEPLRTSLQVRFRDSGGVSKEQDMDVYLLGVVLAEMPAWFEEEALKAQAVVARTYALKAFVTGGKHGDGSVCAQSGCCQAYISQEAYLAAGGKQQAVEKVRSAVEATSGQVLVYDGALIEATYFSCSGGQTEDAAAVWGTDYPYLRSVSSPGEESAAHYTDTVYFAAEDFCEALGIPQQGDPVQWIDGVSHTPGAGIAQVTIGGKIFTGVQLRQLLSLRSTAISMEVRDGGILVTTRGFGHRVGMSQYGADAMAVAGSMYPDILSHYYSGAALVVWEEYAIGNSR